MEPLIYLEVVDRRGNVRERFRIDSFPAGIGRSYRNSVILSDRYVSPEHVRITRDEQGELWAEDLGTDNGVYLDGDQRKVGRFGLRAGTQFRVGRTLLRVATPDQPVEPAVREAAPSGRFARFALSLPGTLILGGSAIVVIMVNSWLESYQRVTPVQLLSEALTIMILVLLWVGGWSFVNRVVSHRFAFLNHLALGSAAAMVLILQRTGTEYFEFFFAPSPVLHWVDVGTTAILLAALLYGHLSIISAITPRRRVIAAAAVSLALFGFVELSTSAGERFSPAMLSPAPLKPVGASLLRTMSVDEFLTEARTLKVEVDSLASKE